MKRREFLQGAAALLGWLAISGIPLNCTAKGQRDYYHILLISDLHLPGAYYARDIGSCRLLYLSPDGCHSAVDLSPEQLDWLKQEVAQHQKGPILFFCHAPLAGSLRTYHPKINTVAATTQPANTLADILANVPPGSLWISGHTHTPPTNDSYADIKVNRVNPHLVNIHNPTIDTPHLYTNSLYICKDHLVIRTYDYNNGKWLDKLERTFPFTPST